MRLEPQAPGQELLGRAVREALVAAHLAGVRAERAVGAADHLAVGGADAHELVEGEHDLRLGQDPAGERQQVRAIGEEMVEMDHVRPDQLEELDERLDHRGEPVLCHQ